MLDKLRVKSWYYAACTTLAGILIAACIHTLAMALGRADTLTGINLTPISAAAGVLELIIGFVIGGPFIERLPKNKERSLRWFVRQPFMWQFVVFVFTAVVLLAGAAFLHANTQNSIVAAVDIGLNISFTAASLYFLYAFCRMMLYRKP